MSQLKRYLIGQECAELLGVDDFQFFPVLPDESVTVCRNRVNALLRQWKATEMWRWSVRSADGGVIVRKIGRWGDDKAIGRQRLTSDALLLRNQGYSLEMIGNVFGVSRQSVAQYIKRCVKPRG